MNPNQITNNLKEFVNDLSKEKFIHSKSDRLVLFKPTNKNSYFNSKFYIADNNIFSRRSYAQQINNGIENDFYNINFQFKQSTKTIYQKDWNKYVRKIRQYMKNTNIKKISLNLYHPCFSLYWNFWHFTLEELSKLYMYFELKKIIPDLKICITLNRLNYWIKEFLFDILEIKMDDLYDISDISDISDKILMHNTKINILSNTPFLKFDKFIYDNFYYEKIIKKVCKIDNSNKYFKKYFNLRHDDPRKNSRNISNYNEVKELLSKYEYYPFDNLKLSVKESINQFHNMKYLIIDNGAQLTNLLWCNKDVKIIFIDGPHACKCHAYLMRAYNNINNNTFNFISKKGNNHNNNWVFDETMKKEFVEILEKQE